MLPVFVYMEVAQTFIPTAGTSGILPMITYFLLVVAMLAFLGNFIFILTSYTRIAPEPAASPYRQMPIIVLICSAITGWVYYFLQSYYHDMLAELATVGDLADRQTLLRESYNAVGQYRYMGWFITTPLLLIHIVAIFKIQFDTTKRPIAALVVSTLFMVLASYIGHQQVSFDNEIQVGPKAIWGLIALIDYVFILFTLNKLWKQTDDSTPLNHQPQFRFKALPILTIWGVYLLGFFLTLLPIDFNWIHILFTLADLISIIGIGLVAYVSYSQTESTASANRLENN
ncbi:hypothetical protein GCM10028805_14870 [Spirosoma harenae]